MRRLFLLDPEIAYLDHGSFGACPRPVFEAYQRYQRELERQPAELLARRLPERLAAVRARLAAYVGADPADLALVPNATSGMSTVARSLRLAPGDEVLASDREYEATDAAWRLACRRAGARYVRRPPEELGDALGERTRVLSLSHVASPTAEILEPAALCARARELGVLTVVDGAHAPGHVPVDLTALGADAYAGNCHKWLCAPKGAGFLWVRPGLQDEVVPLAIGSRWEEGGDFARRHEWQGTRDPSAWLAVPDAIDFQDEHGWDAVRARCHALAEEAQRELAALTGVAPLAGAFGQMVACPLPPCDVDELRRRLRDEHRVEVAGRTWGGRPLLRVSFQAYNDERDLERLLEGLRATLAAR